MDIQHKKEILHHPLKIKDGVNSDKFKHQKPTSSVPDELNNLLGPLNKLMNNNLPELPELNDTKLLLSLGLIKRLSSFTWKPFFNQQNEWMLFAEIPFEYPNIPNIEALTAIATLKESFAQYFTETFQKFGACYGKSNRSWVIYLPMTFPLSYSIFESEFKNQIKLHWTRFSNVYGKFTCVSNLTPSDLITRSVDSTTALQPKTKTTFFRRIHVHPNNIKIKTPLIAETNTTQSLFENLNKIIFKSATLLNFLEQAKIPHLFYNELKSDPCCHIAIHEYAINVASNSFFEDNNQTKIRKWNDFDLSDPRFILVIAIYPEEYQIIDQKLNEAFEKSILEKKTYQISGTLQNPQLTQVNEETSSYSEMLQNPLSSDM